MSERKLVSIQILRGVAASGVVFHHFYQSGDLPSRARLGAAGVDLFFVISGFIMATVAGSRTPGQFLIDRVRRIYPLWFIAALPWVVFVHHDAGRLLTTATLWPIWGQFYIPALDVGWSLCFEMLFYLVFAFGLVTSRWAPFVVFGAFIPCGLLFENVPLWRFLGDPLALEFLAGVTIARMPMNERIGIPLVLVALLLFAVSPVSYFAITTRSVVFIRVATWGIPAALMVYGFRSAERHFDPSICWFPLLIGDASYSIYLFHKLLVGFFSWQLGIPLALFGGILVHLFIERRLVRKSVHARAIVFARIERRGALPVSDQPL